MGPGVCPLQKILRRTLKQFFIHRIQWQTPSAVYWSTSVNKDIVLLDCGHLQLLYLGTPVAWQNDYNVHPLQSTHCFNGCTACVSRCSCQQHPHTYISGYTCCVAGWPQCPSHFSLGTASIAAMPMSQNFPLYDGKPAEWQNDCNVQPLQSKHSLNGCTVHASKSSCQQNPRILTFGYTCCVVGSP